MTASQQHPQRCETCKHYQTRFEYGNKKICTLIKEKAPGSYQIGIPFNIDIVGCASHSASGPVPEPNPCEDCDRCRFVKDCTPLYVPPCYNGAAVKAAKQARVEVLDALKSELEEMGCMGDVCCRGYLKNEWLPRQQEEP